MPANPTDMNVEYDKIFAHRGKAYHNAMRRFPRARDAEFSRLFEASAPRPGQRILDLPSGGGYLRRHLPGGVESLGMELTNGFDAQVPVYQASQPWTFGRFDHAVCLAALHHISDQTGFLRMLLTRLQAHGTLHLADVASGSGIARFLDEFVGRYNMTGHHGHYLPHDPGRFAVIGKVTRIGERPCPWRFDNEQHMLDFCQGLFGLVDCPLAALRDALHDHIGFRRREDHVLLDWRLLYVDLQPT